MVIAVPRWSGLRLLTSRRTGFVWLMALADRRLIGTASVPFWLGNAVGSTFTRTVAGVTPLEGEKVTPVWLERLKSVLPPPGSVIDRLSVMALRLQKLPLANRSVWTAATRC